MRADRVIRLALLALALVVLVPQPAAAAWLKPGACRIPASWDDYLENLDRENNRFSTRKVPCYIAGYAIDAMLREGTKWRESEFSHTSMGARWYVRLACRGRNVGTDEEPRRTIRCRVRRGEDAETRRGRVRNLSGGSITWTTTFEA